MGTIEIHITFLAENLKRRYNSGDLGICRIMTLKLNLKKFGVRVWIELIWLRRGF
jgi:hypothetical protein